MNEKFLYYMAEDEDLQSNHCTTAYSAYVDFMKTHKREPDVILGVLKEDKLRIQAKAIWYKYIENSRQLLEHLKNEGE